VSREHRRAKTDRLDTALLKRALLGWLRGEREHFSMSAIPSLEEEDAKRPRRERESLVGERTRIRPSATGSKARSHGSASAVSNRPCARPHNGLEPLRTPEGEQMPLHTGRAAARDGAVAPFR
jgi:transposase